MLLQQTYKEFDDLHEAGEAKRSYDKLKAVSTSGVWASKRLIFCLGKRKNASEC